MDGQRYAISVRLIGVMQKEKSKMYITSVLWSDQSDIIVYRGFGDFKELHKQLKKKFPTAIHRKSDRIIPKFQDRRMKRSAQKNGPSKSVVRLKFLEKYCTELLGCNERVSQCSLVIQFFHPKDQDLKPEYAQNSIVIMPSEATDGGISGGQDKSFSVGNVTQPFVTETYRCVATYETKDTKNRAFKVAVDEEVDVLIKDKAGWWLIENEDKRLAWFPAPYLEKMDDDEFDDDDDDDDEEGTNGDSVMYSAGRSYKATNKDEVSVEIGCVVEALQKSDNGWWLVRYNGQTGYIPSMYLQRYNNPSVRMVTLKQDLGRSNLNLAQLHPPGSLAGHSHELSRSQDNLRQPASLRPSSPNQLTLPDKNKSRSLNMLASAPASPRPAPRMAVTTTPPTPPPASRHPATPTILVEDNDDGGGEAGGPRWRSATADSDFSGVSDDSELSFNSDFSSSSGSSSLNLSRSYDDERIRLSRTPPPMRADRQESVEVADEGKMAPSSSDPNLFKRPTTPKVPPRPRAQEILTRCTTVTRKNVSKARLSPGSAMIQSR